MGQIILDAMPSLQSGNFWCFVSLKFKKKTKCHLAVSGSNLLRLYLNIIQGTTTLLEYSQGGFVALAAADNTSKGLLYKSPLWTSGCPCNIYAHPWTCSSCMKSIFQCVPLYCVKSIFQNPLCVSYEGQINHFVASGTRPPASGVSAWLLILLQDLKSLIWQCWGVPLSIQANPNQ